MTTPAPRVRLYPPNALQLTLRLVQAGQEAAVVLGATSSGGAAVAQGVADGWRDAAWTSFRSLITSTVTCTGAILRDVSKPDGLVQESGPPATTVGGVAGASGLAAASTLIRWTTTRGGRSGKGRTFLPGLATAAVDSGGRAYSAAHGTAVNTAVAAYLDNPFWAAQQLVPAVLSFDKGFASPITSGALASVVGVQRRRMR